MTDSSVSDSPMSDSGFRNTHFSTASSSPSVSLPSAALPSSVSRPRPSADRIPATASAADICASICAASDDSRALAIERAVFAALTHVTDPELGRSIVDLRMVTGIAATLRTEESGLERPPQAAENQPIYDVRIDIELTVSGCPLTQQILDAITRSVERIGSAGRIDSAERIGMERMPFLAPAIKVSSMSSAKFQGLVADLKAARRRNPFDAPDCPTKIFAVASGKGGVGKSSVAANLAATLAALGYSTAAIDADIYGFSLPGIFGVRSQPTDLDGMLMPVSAWGVKLMSIGMFAGTDQPILWRGPRLQRSLQQFLADVWWGTPDALVLDLPPGTGDMAISVAQMLPSAQVIVVTTPQPSAASIAARAGLMTLQLPGHVRGVIENMSWYEHRGERLPIFGSGGGQAVADRLSDRLGYPVPLLGQIPLESSVRTDGEAGRPTVLDEHGQLTDSPIAQRFTAIAMALMAQ